MLSMDGNQMTRKDDVRRPDQYNGLRMDGKFELRARFPDGRIETRSGKNLVVTSGEHLAAQLFDINGSETAPNYIAFGSGNATVLKADTQLQTEVASTREEVDDTDTPLPGVIQMSWDLTTGSSYTLREMGIFNAVSAGTMVSRFLTQPLDIVSGVVFAIVWTLTFSGVD